MAKRKTPKVEALRPSKISEEQLTTLKNLAKGIGSARADIGALEVRKHEAMHAIMEMQGMLLDLQNKFKEQYGTHNFDINDGTIKYNEDGNNEANKKNNDR